MVRSGEQGESHMSDPIHLPGLDRSEEIWDSRGDGSVIEWRAYSFFTFPQANQYSRAAAQSTPHDFHESLHPSISRRWIDKIQFDGKHISSVDATVPSHVISVCWQFSKRTNRNPTTLILSRTMSFKHSNSTESYIIAYACLIVCPRPLFSRTIL